MKKYILLTLLILFFSSCSIDGNNNKEKQIIFNNNYKCNDFYKRYSNTKNIKYSYKLNSCIGIYIDEISFSNKEKGYYPGYFIKNIFDGSIIYQCEGMTKKSCKKEVFEKFKVLK